ALDGSPRIAVPFRDGNDSAFIARAVELGVHIAELRIDQFAKRDAANVLNEIEKFKAVPILATIRSAAEGGNWHDSDSSRLALYKAILPKIDAVDVELSSSAIAADLTAAAHALHKPVILSFHDFAKTPPLDTLNAIVRDARSAGADIVKVAAMCNSQDDVRTLTRFTLDHAHEGVVVIGMGPIGITTRVLLPALGSLFTFAAYGEGTAPGQLQLEEMATIFAKLYPAL
ncbi:MAG: type I 3-dehydroquinate dehydratase, partial [Candidatus Hydrogenedentes bacterium]|nr:type I 3-dehydroquinate dehydratase [Candidatus Hydrogenedentota bacterium]